MRKYKKTEFLDEQEEDQQEKEELSWDFKKIAIGLIVLGLLVAAGVYAKDTYLPQYLPQLSPRQQVQGAETSPDDPSKYKMSIPSATDLQSTFEQKVSDLREQVNNLTPQEVASSSPSVQKLLNDIKDIQQYPNNQAKETCMNICSRL